ncbi:MAG: SMC-Scp complex subunit ScpB [Patescibacteria group bacterium]|nr:SMC-Scp complex subunit ScpB [Patescibacteria group bacterium]
MEKEEINIVAVLESVLFMYGREISFARIGELLDLSEEDVVQIVKTLQEEYKKRENCGLRIIVKDDVVQMVTHPNSAKVIEQITKKELEGPLTPVAMEVLSIIVYREPISKIDIEAIRGVNCSFSIRNLLRRGLIERVHTDKAKRIQQYQTTIDLLRLLGIESVEELPEFDELSTDKRIDAILYNEVDNQGTVNNG